MKVICICIDNKISTKAPSDLTIGKVYDAIGTYGKVFFLTNDKGKRAYYHKDRFITLEEWRDKILNNLLES